MEILRGRALPIATAGLLATTLVAALLADRLSWFWLAVLGAGALGWRISRRSLFADGLLTFFGLALACLPVVGLNYLARQEEKKDSSRYDLSRLEKSHVPVVLPGEFQLCGGLYLPAKERVYTRDYGWLQPIYSRLHPRFPGNRGPNQPPTFYMELDRDHLERLAHRFLPPAPQAELRDQLLVRQTRTGFLQEQPGHLLVLPCQARAQALALAGIALFAVGLSLLVANLGHQQRARHKISRWDRDFGS